MPEIGFSDIIKLMKKLLADKEELLKVYNNKHEYSGKMELRSKVHQSRLFHDEIVLWVINPNKKKVLVQKRSPNKLLRPNRYGLCAGHVVENETIEEALFKEAMEEIGLDLSKYNVQHILTVKQLAQNNYHFAHHFAIFEEIPLENFKIQEEELTEVKYMNYEDFKYRIRTGDDSVVVKWTYAEKQVFNRLDKILYGEIKK